MKIAILGTRGIPNNYGGFEQFAEFISVGLAERGHEVVVYNPHFHPFKKDEYKGVKIIRKYSPEKYLGASANFIYDFLCLNHAVKSEFDIIYEAGYGTVSIFYPLFSKVNKVPIVTNMDGLEWKRSKWNKTTKKLMKRFESLAVKHSNFLIADNIGIYNFFKKQYNVECKVLEYGANIVEEFDENLLTHYDISKEEGFSLIIARLEPENNIEMILNAFLQSKHNSKIVIVGNHNSKYGNFLKIKYQHNSVKFVGPIYSKEVLDSMRFFCTIYFHGHSVGGTNPSLLEAMSAQSYIIAHDNEFNRAVICGKSLFFGSTEALRNILDKEDYKLNREEIINENLSLIKEKYSWEKIISDHHEYFKSILM